MQCTRAELRRIQHAAWRCGSGYGNGIWGGVSTSLLHTAQAGNMGQAQTTTPPPVSARPVVIKTEVHPMRAPLSVSCSLAHFMTKSNALARIPTNEPSSSSSSRRRRAQARGSLYTHKHTHKYIHKHTRRVHNTSGTDFLIFLVYVNPNILKLQNLYN